MDCAACHSPDGWGISASQWAQRDLNDKSLFNHAQTGFALNGQHEELACIDCHSTLVFEQSTQDCRSCHTDIHRSTVGNDCMRCHTTSNWLVDNVQELHFDNGFPLLGAHATANCTACHQSATQLEFNRLGNDCFTCHAEDYVSTTTPNHATAGYSTDCVACHDPNAVVWTGGILHDFFPLEQGHAIADCFACHSTNTYSGLSSECVSCHLSDYQTAGSPNHLSAGFPTDCKLCHTLAPSWQPASFNNHDDNFFPIFSGKHRGEWNDCTDCHTMAGNFSAFSCIDCHEHNNRNRLTNEHDEVSGFVYESNACYACHPDGEE